MIKGFDYLGRQSTLCLYVLAFAITALVGTLDYLTGPELSFSIFYLIPICLSTWFLGRRPGLLIAIASGVAGLIADVLHISGHLSSALPYWDTLVRMGPFLIVVYALSALHISLSQQEDLAQYLVHDLRSPLSNVMTGLQAMRYADGGITEDTRKAIVQTCLASCNRMLLLINSLLDLSRLETGQFRPNPRETTIADLVELAADQVRTMAELSGVALKSQVNGEIRAVYADFEVTMRILVNVLGNAIKFSRPESTVLLRVTPFGSSQVAFSVTDQGQGIPQEWVDKVFDKYAQVEAHKAGKFLGSGLGLTFCRLAVEAQGGNIWLESEVCKGTTVTFTLPICRR